MDLPGVDPKAVEVSVEKGVLTVSGERQKAESNTQYKGYRHQESVQGSFKRRFKLPEDADVSEILAASEHGVLRIEIEKVAEQQSRRIEITH